MSIERLLQFFTRKPNRKAERIKNYPVAAVDGGIKACISNSRQLLDSAWFLLNQNKLEHSFIFYTYAEEEFGKALLMLDKKSEAVAKAKMS